MAIYPKHNCKTFPITDERYFSVNGKAPLKKNSQIAGINLKEVNFKTMESKLHENLYFMRN
jgi:predicted flavoprotein YhiN